MTFTSVESRTSTRGRVLVFCRNYLVADFQANVAPLSDEFNFEFLTDGASPLAPDTRRAFYSAMARSQSCPAINPATEADVIARCRLLRHIDRAQAQRMVHAMAHVLGAELDRIRPQAVLCHWVDEYVTHLLSILAERRGARFIGYAYSYFPGLAQLVARADGTALNVRTPTELEVAAALQVISERDFRQNYAQALVYSRAHHVRRVGRYLLKRCVFALKARLERDPWNLHYAVTPYIVERRSISDYPSSRLFTSDWNEAVQQARKSKPDAMVIYLPLAYFPESTTDYWIENTSILQYEDKVLEICRTLASNALVVVKEHVHMLGCRRPSFYARLNEIAGVVNVHPSEISNKVLVASDAVIVGGGSVGVEAVIRGKPIFSYCATSFWFEAAGAHWLDLDEVAGWGKKIAGALAHLPAGHQRDKQSFVTQCLRSTVRTRPGAKRWLLMNENDLRMTLRNALRAAEPKDQPTPTTAHATTA